ncbi:MoaD/ThiS family protein [Micromonospora polyrhachis]|nr:MoaD/ThiS family protein [Micromonospora polyrhachis]
MRDGLTVRYFAGARAAAGVDEEAVPLSPSLDRLAESLVDQHGPRLATVLAAASYLVDGVAWHDRQAPLPQGATIDVLPPFAGG